MSSTANSQPLEILLLADVHYVNHAARECPIPTRKAAWGRELMRRALREARRHGPVDVVVLLGDLVDDGAASGAEDDLRELCEGAGSLETPIIVVPGNHDGDAARLARLFGHEPGVHRIKGYQLLTFADRYEPNDEAARGRDDLDALAQAVAAHPESPVVAFQHNPIHPPIESTYPFNLTNAADVMRAYERAGVLLSVSAHYHPGLAAEAVNGVSYMTCPALCEAPFRFVRLSLAGRSFRVAETQLVLDPPTPLRDFHVHTQYAYCRDDVTAAAAIERAEALGVDGICLTEHAGQLYLSPEDYWSHRFAPDPGLIARERAAGRGRLRRFREEIEPLRSPRVGVGLEVELDGSGGLTLLDEDREGWDVLIGAVHRLANHEAEGASSSDVTRAFMAETERLVSLGIDLLAHPFRYFRRAKMPVPTELYRPVAEALAVHGVAAEINYHTNEPDPAFFAMCLEHGVKIALGSDSHGLWEVGDLNPHLQLLEQIVPRERMGDVLYRGRTQWGTPVA
jgi:histidinol phosphatase-like PHP family hydrolase/predicted MPP superfamily phosphohydrolase